MIQDHIWVVIFVGFNFREYVESIRINEKLLNFSFITK